MPIISGRTKHRSLAVAAQNVVRIMSRDREGALLCAPVIFDEIPLGNSRPVLLHSYRSATIGSMLMARRAGTRIATAVAASRSSGIPMNVAGSFAVTP